MSNLEDDSLEKTYIDAIDSENNVICGVSILNKYIDKPIVLGKAITLLFETLKNDKNLIFRVNKIQVTK